MDGRSIGARATIALGARSVGFFLTLPFILCHWSAGAAELVAVKTIQPEKVDLRRLTTQPGTVYAFHEAELYAKVAGYLKVLHVDIGDEVEAGDKLAEIDVPEMRKDVERQKAEVTRQQYEVARLDALVKVAQARVGEAQANLKEVEARITADKSEYARIKELVQTKAVTQSLHDETLNRLQASEAALASKKASTSVARAELDAARASVESAKAAKKVEQKEFEKLEVLMDYAILRAPFKGVVTQRNVDPGDLVYNAQNSPGDGRKPLFTIARMDKVRVRVAVPERDAVWVDVGDEAHYQLAALSTKPFEGKVTRFSKSLDTITRSMLVEIELPNPGGRLMPGMFGLVTIVVEEHPNSLVLPAGSIRNSKDGADQHVYVVNSDNQIQHVPVTTGLDDGIRIEIVRGLQGGERVVTGMLGRLASGQSVRLLN